MTRFGEHKVLIICFVILTAIVGTLFYPTSQSYVDSQKIARLASMDLVSTLSQNYTMVEGSPIVKGISSPSVDFSDFIRYSKDRNVSIIYYSVDGSRAQFRIIDEVGKRFWDYSIKIVMVKGFPSNEYTWVNPVTGNKIVLGCALIRLS
jgi:hypothetical protein